MEAEGVGVFITDTIFILYVNQPLLKQVLLSKTFCPWFSTVLLSDKMEEKVQQIQFQQEISNYKDEIRDLQEKLETLKVRKGAKKPLKIKKGRI
jgi:hypothetical protein